MHPLAELGVEEMEDDLDTEGLPRCNPMENYDWCWDLREIRVCRHCKLDQPLEIEFHRKKGSPRGRDSVCRSCRSYEQRAWRTANKGKVEGYRQAWLARRRQCVNLQIHLQDSRDLIRLALTSKFPMFKRDVEMLKFYPL